MTNVSARKTTNRGEEWTTIQGISDNYELQFLENLNERIGYSAGTGLKLSKSENDLDLWNRLIINDNFADVSFVSQQKGFAISGSLSDTRGLYKTTDGGINWDNAPDAPGGNDLFFLDDLIGFVGNNLIYKTNDGGETWSIANVTGLTDTLGSINKIFFIDSTTGWAVTSRGGILKSTDVGENWFAQLNAGASVVFQSIFFLNALNGWTANLSLWSYKTTNGGNNWIQQTTLNIFGTRDILFLNPLTGITAKSNELYKTTNSGNSWSLIPDVTGFSIAARLSHYDEIIFVTGYTTYRSTDAGQDWEEYSELNGLRINGLSLLGAGLGYAVGEFGVILKYYDESVPVELVSFSATIETNKVNLNWITATEVNNLGFEVERQVVSKQPVLGNENVTWEKIGFLKGYGTTSETQFYSFVDENLKPGLYAYRLKQIDFDGSFEYSSIISVEVKPTSQFKLNQNFPNPFNPSTIINYQIPNDGFVTLKVYDILGREVKTLVNEPKTAGRYDVNFDASSLVSGVYLYKINAGSFVQTRKMILLK